MAKVRFNIRDNFDQRTIRLGRYVEPGIQVFEHEENIKIAQHIINHTPIADLDDFTRLLNGQVREAFVLVLSALEQGGIVEVHRHLEPIEVVKGPNFPPYI